MFVNQSQKLNIYTQINIINKFVKKLAIHNYLKDEYRCVHLLLLLPIRLIGNYNTLSDMI